MNKLSSIILGMFVFLFLSATSVFACSCCGKKAESTPTTHSCQNSCGVGCSSAETSCSEKPLDVKNLNCPVSGQPIGSMGEGVSVTHNGKSYQLCCAGCIEKFKGDPEKYAKNIK